MSKQKNKNLVKKFFWILLATTFLGISGWALFFSNYTEIGVVKIKTDKIDSKPIKEIFNNLKEEEYFNLIPKNNFFLFPRGNFTELVKNEFELVRQVKFENKFPNTIKIETEERGAIVIWCSQEKCFLLDEQGIIFRELLGNERDERFEKYLIIEDKSFEAGKLGERIEDGQLAIFLKKAEVQLREKLDLKIKRETLTPSLISREIRIKTEENWEIYFSLDQEIEDQILLLKEVLETEIRNREELNYLDLRIEGKVIYKSGS